MMEAGGLGKVTQAYCPQQGVSAFAYMADVKAPHLQKLEMWLMH